MEHKQPLRVEQQPSIGPALLSIGYRQRGNIPPLPPGMGIVSHLEDRQAETEVDLTPYLHRIELELISLRQDLYARSLEGRWHRLVAWVKSLWKERT